MLSKSCMVFDLTSLIEDILTGISLSMVVLNSRDQQGNVWLPSWINSSVIISAKKLAIHLLIYLYQC